MSRLSASGEAPGMRGESSLRPRYSVVRSMGCLLSGRRRGSRRDRNALLELLVKTEPLLDVALCGLDQLAVPLWILVFGHAEARLVAHVRGEIALGRRRI